MNITSSYQVRIVNCSVNLIDTVHIYQKALSYLIGVVSENWDAIKTVKPNIRNSIKCSISILRTCAVQQLQLLSVQ